MNRKKLLLTILVGLFALSLVYAIREMPRQEKVSAAASPRPEPPRLESTGRPPAPATEARVRLELLTREPADFPGFKRNIFRFRQPAPPPLPMPTAARVAPPPPPPPVAVESTPVTAAVQKELARFNFLGFLLKDGIKTVFLSSENEIFTVKQGDRFGKGMSFFVTDLSPSMLTIRQADDPRPITVPLVEQAPLAAAPTRSLLRESPRPGAPMQRRGPFSPQRTGEVRPPLEPTEPPPGEAVPVEQSPTEESIPPQDVAPSEVPHD